MTARCEQCGRPVATEEDYARCPDPCPGCDNCTPLCWRGWTGNICYAAPIDWRTRALAAEERAAKAEAELEAARNAVRFIVRLEHPDEAVHYVTNVEECDTHILGAMRFATREEATAVAADWNDHGYWMAAVIPDEQPSRDARHWHSLATRAQEETTRERARLARCREQLRAAMNVVSVARVVDVALHDRTHNHQRRHERFLADKEALRQALAAFDGGREGE